MSRLHRRILAVIVGIAAVLGVIALSQSASFGPDAPSASPVAATRVVAAHNTRAIARARAELARARADMRKALSERRAAAARVQAPRRVVRIVHLQVASAPIVRRGDQGENDDREHESGGDD